MIKHAIISIRFGVLSLVLLLLIRTVFVVNFNFLGRSNDKSHFFEHEQNQKQKTSSTTSTYIPYSIRTWNHIRNAPPSLGLQVNRTDGLDVTLTFAGHQLQDRMGSRLQLPYSVWLVAHYRGWKFCSPPDRLAEALSFPTCSPRIRKEGTKEFQFTNIEEVKDSGLHFVPREKNSLWNLISDNERRNQSMFEDGVVENWRRMILEAKVKPEFDEELWLSNDTVRIAAHVRRGDIYPGQRNDVWVGDDQVIALIEMAKYYTRQKLGDDVKTEVHIFSESSGLVNWTRYGSLVDAFHLAPPQGDNDRNLRDWKHFVLADVLIAGNTFSRVPAYARPGASPDDGFPLTISWRKGAMPPRNDWISWKWIGGGWQAVVANFPNGTITARIGEGREPTPNNVTLTVKTMLEGLCPACKASAQPGAHRCDDRIGKYSQHAGSDFSIFAEVQKKASLGKACTACDPDTCRVRVARGGPVIPIESVIGIPYEQMCPTPHDTCLEEEYGYL